jgi:hypothetical protein
MKGIGGVEQTASYGFHFSIADWVLFCRSVYKDSSDPPALYMAL